MNQCKKDTKIQVQVTKYQKLVQKRHKNVNLSKKTSQHSVKMTHNANLGDQNSQQNTNLVDKNSQNSVKKIQKCKFR